MIRSINMDDAQWSELRTHLFKGGPEQAAFLFVVSQGSIGQFVVADWMLLDENDFDYQSDFHISLADHVRPAVIKKAWDTNTALVEVHSHRTPKPACFSPSDISGLREFVPHVLWRLPDRPYGALVLAETSFDSLTWEGGDTQPRASMDVFTESEKLAPTGLSLKSWGDPFYG